MSNDFSQLYLIKIIICKFIMFHKNLIVTVIVLDPLGMVFLCVKELGTQVDEIDMASRSKKIQIV